MPDMHGLLLSCRDRVYAALVEEMEHRSDAHDWVDRERYVVASAATAWAAAHDLDRVTVEDVERIEGAAVGHADYASKLALYVADYVCRPRIDRLP